MAGDWTLIEFRPGRYAKVSPNGDFLGLATEAEVRTWFAVPESADKAQKRTPPPADSRAQPKPITKDGADQPYLVEAPAPDLDSHPFLERMQRRGMRIGSSDENTQSGESSETVPGPLPPFLERMRGDPRRTETNPEPLGTDESVEATEDDLLPSMIQAQDYMLGIEDVTGPQNLVEPPLTTSEEPVRIESAPPNEVSTAESKPQTRSKPPKPEHTPVRPPVVEPSLLPNADVVKTATDLRPQPPEPSPDTVPSAKVEPKPADLEDTTDRAVETQTELFEFDLDQDWLEEEAYKAVEEGQAEKDAEHDSEDPIPAYHRTTDRARPTSRPEHKQATETSESPSGVGRWLWVDPRQEIGYNPLSFDLMAFLRRAVALFQAKEWAAGQKPGRLAVHPADLAVEVESLAETLGLEVVSDPLVNPGTFRLGLPEEKA